MTTTTILISVAIMLILVYLCYHADTWRQWHEDIDGEAKRISEDMD